jgi:RecB family exonuclease
VHKGVPIPAARWDGLSAAAGVTQGLDEWGFRLTRRAAAMREEASWDTVDGEEQLAPRQSALLAEARQSETLLDFLTDINAALGTSPSGWLKWASWAKGLLHRLVGGPGAFGEWPIEERTAATAVEEAIDQLAVLEELSVPFTMATAKSALAAELSASAPQITRFGVGVWVAPVSAVVGHQFDVLYVIGMNDGHFPAPPGDDVLIPDREREDAQLHDEIPLRGGRSVAMRRDYLAALAGAQTVVLSYPRGNQRDGRALRPSRWALDTLVEITEPKARLYSNDLESLAPTDRYRIQPSYLSAVASGGAPMSLADRNVRSLLLWQGSGKKVADHFLCEESGPLQRGTEMLAGRARGFTRFDGRLTDILPGHDLVPHQLSATRLESFAACPRRYFFESVLSVFPRPTDEQLYAIDRMARGTLLHRILELYVEPHVDQHAEDASGPIFKTVDLLAIAEEQMADFESRGLSGPTASWTVEKVRIRRELRHFAAVDREWRTTEGLVTTGVEHRFGYDEVPAVMVATAGHRPVSFRGSIDRVDVTPDGTPVVSDYKTGRSDRFKKIEDDDFAGGTALQLAVYGLAVRADARHPVRSSYWFVSERGGFARHGYTLTPDREARFSEVVGVLADTMSHGQFPANPVGSGRVQLENCTYCAYNDVCPGDREAGWARSREDPALAAYVELAEST